ncbi:hypothetical protein EGW08_016254, partial [Elysia chlorotica]
EDAAITDLEPGLFTVYFEETKFIKGSPFRIILLDNSEINFEDGNITDSLEIEKKSCLLLDHIPHNDHAVISDRCLKKGNEYPLGICAESSYYITVRIPDVSCEDCSLIVQQVDVPTVNAVCDLNKRNDSIGNCYVFTSCARVRIRPTVDGLGNDLSVCENYLDNIPGDWPYRPEDLYRTNQGAALTFDLLHKNLHIEIPKSTNRDYVIRKIEIMHNNQVVWEAHVDQEQGIIDAHLLTWKALNDSQAQSLRAGEYVLNVINSKTSKADDIIFSGQHFSESKMGTLHDMYSHGGWLVSHKFLGPLVEDPMAAFPVGQCAPKAHIYVAYLHSVHITAHGILGMTVIENRAYITAVLHEDHEEIQTIRIIPPNLVNWPKIHIDVLKPFKGVFQAVIDISPHLPYLETVRFLISVEVKTDKEDAVMVGDLEEGMYTVLRDENNKIKGMGALQFTQSQSLRIEIVLNGLSPTIKAAHIFGMDSKLADLGRNSIHCTHKFCCLETTYREITSELIMYLMNGQAIMHVDSGAGNVSGKVIVPTHRYCEMMDGTCERYQTNFTLYGIGYERTDKSKNSLEAGMGWTQTGVYVMDRANVLLYCLQFTNVDASNQSLKASLMIGDRLIDSTTLQPSAQLSNSYFSCSQTLLRADYSVLDSLAGKGEKKVILTVKKGEETISQGIPIVHRSNCTIPKIIEIGKEKDQWSTDSAPLDDVYAVVYDDLQFLFKETTVFMADDQEAFDTCDFDKAHEMTKIDHIRDWKNFWFHIKEAGTFFFLDRDSCNSSTPLKLVAHVAEPENIVDRADHSSWCSASVFAVWRERLLKDYNGPDVSVPLIVGIVLGIACSVACLVWQGIRLKIIPSLQGRQNGLF